MKSLFAILLVASFIGVAVFGVLGMGHGNDHSRNCIAITANRADCPNASRLLDFIIFHLDAFQSFSTAIFSENFLNALLPLSVSLLFFGFGIFLFFHFRPPQFNVSLGYQFLERFSSPQKQQLTRWLALHENSPTIQ